ECQTRRRNPLHIIGVGTSRISLKNLVGASNNDWGKPVNSRHPHGVQVMSAFLRKFGLLAIVGGLLTTGVGRAEVTTKPGQLIVEDNGKLFSDGGITRAKEEFARGVHSKTGRQVTVETLAMLPAAQKEKHAKIDKKDRSALDRFWADFAKSEAKADNAHGIYILISWDPGHVEILADEEMRRKGFDESKKRELRDILVKVMGEAKSKAAADQTPIRDRAL